MLFHGYLVFISTFVLNFVGFGQFNASSLYINPLQESFPESGSGTLALFCNIQIVAALASSLAGGIAQDALEAADIGLNWLFFAGGLFMFIGLVGASYAPTLIGVLVGSTTFGIGLGLAAFMSAGMCVLWFEQSRGTMLLLAISGEGFGSVFSPWIMVKLLKAYDEYEDPWRPTMRWLGLLSLIVSAFAAAPMRLPFPGEVEENEKGINGLDEIVPLAANKNYGSMQFDANDNHYHARRRRSSVIAFEKVRRGSVQQATKRTSIVDGVADGLRRASLVSAYQALTRASSYFDNELAPPQDREGSYSLSDVALSKTNLWLGAFTVVACFAILNAQVLLPPYILSVGFGDAVAGFAITLFGSGVLMSNLTLGVVVDKFGARKVLAFGFTTMALLFFVWPLCVTTSQIYVLSFWCGYFQGPISSLPIIILADAFANSSPEHILALNGITNGCKFPGYLFGSAIASSIAEKYGAYSNATALSGIVLVAGASMLLLIPSPDEQQRQLAEKKSNDHSSREHIAFS